jgi:acetoacetyl-CoA synthetase
MTVVDALCVGQKIGLEKADERVLLFVKLLDGVKLSPELSTAIAKEVRSRRSPRHVPAKVSGASLSGVSGTLMFHPCQCIQVDDIPHTLNGKKVEVPVRKVSRRCSDLTTRPMLNLATLPQIMNGAPLSSINLATLSNPECLPAYVNLARGLGEEAARL